MARQETIEVKLAKAAEYKTVYDQLKNEAEALEKLYANLKMGNASQQNAQAAAARAAAQAAQQNAQAQTAQANATAANLRVQREQVNLDNARQRSIRDLTATQAEQTRLQREQTDLTAANTRVQREQVNIQNANIRTVRDLNDAQAANVRLQTEQVNLQTAQIRQQNLVNQGAQRHAAMMRNLGQLLGTVNAAQYQNIEYMRQYIQTQNGMANAQVTATGTIRNAMGTFQTYNAAVTEAGNVTHNYRYAVNQANGDVYQLDKGIKTTTVSIRDLSSVLRAVRTVIGFTGIAQSLRSAFSEMKDMSDQLAEYRKVTGATAQEMEQIRATAYDIAKAYGESASDVIASAANMARAGYRENSVAMAELATKTKLVGDMTQEAADKFLIAVDAAYKYKGNVEQLSAVLDAANALDNQYATTIEKISDGMTLISSLAATAHVPIEQLMAALGTMTAVTQRSGQETARGLRSIFLNIIGDTSTEIEDGVTATEESVKTMSDILNKYAKDVVIAARESGKLINPMEAIVALQKAWKDNQISEADLNKISNALGGKRYYNVFTALIDNPEMYNDMLESIATSLGSAQSEIDILMDSWTRKTEKLRVAWVQLVNESISEGFIKSLIEGGEKALEFAGSLENLAIMAGGALEALRSLSAGISNLRQPGARMSMNTFGGFNLATSIIGASIAAIGLVKSAYEANQRNLREEMKKAVESATASTTTYQSLEDLTRRYDELAKDGIQSEKGELSELKTLQDELNGLVGDQAAAIDLVNGKYGDTLIALQNLTKEQREAAILTAKSALSVAVAGFNQMDFNGTWNSGLTTGINLPGGTNWNALLADYPSFFTGSSIDNNNTPLWFKKPDNEQDIVAFYEEIKRLNLAITAGQEANKSNSAFITAWAKFYNDIATQAEKVKAAYDALEDLNKATEEIGGASGSTGSAEAASNAVDDLSESVTTLATSIEAATKAKEQFDKAMETTKADAFNDYMSAFETFQKELKEGRVNSTAMYAAARMMLGEDAYKAAGGTYQGVMAAMNRAGSAGSVLDAYNILNTKYQDENGTAVEGFGVYELIRKSGVLDERLLRDANGNYFIPDLTDAQISQISAAYGGVMEEVIINALNALDQYDIYGSATDAGLSVGEKKEEEATAEEEVIDSMKQMTKATDTATESASDLATEMENAAEAAAEFTAAVTTSEGGVRSNKSETWKETASSIWGGVKDAFAAANEATKAAAAEKTAEAQQKAAEAAQAAADSLDNAIATLNTLNATGGNADIIAMLNGLNNLKETYEIAIEAVGGTETTEEKLAAIAEALNTVKDEKEIAVSVGLPGTEEGYDAVKSALLAEANGLIDDVEDEDTLHDIACTLVADDGRVLNKDIDDLLRARQTDIITVQVNAETSFASSQIASVENGAYSATIEVSADTDAAKEEITEACTVPYSATINVQDGGTTNDVKAEILGTASGPYDATVNVSQNGAEETQTVIQTVADEPYDAKINVKESGTATARKRIADTADADYNATIHVDDNGTTQTVIDKIDTALEKLGYVEDVDVDPEIEDLVENLNAIKESYTVSIKDGEGTKSTSTLIQNISNALKTIDELKDAGVIDVEFATETSDALLEEANAIIGAVNSDDELEEIWIALEGDDYPITKEIFDILHKKRDSLRLNVSANTGEAETAIRKVESGTYKADVNVGDGGTASETQTGIQTVADGPYNATILAEESGSETAKAAIEDAANGPYNASIEVSENGATAAKAEIAAAASGPFDAKINTSESGSSVAQTKIQSVADGPYDASVNVSDNGTAAAVQRKIDAITGKDVGITLSVENEADFTSKVDELTKPETKTINIEYNEPGSVNPSEEDDPTKLGGAHGGGETYAQEAENAPAVSPYGGAEKKQVVPDSPLLFLIAKGSDSIFGTNLAGTLPTHDVQGAAPEYDETFFRPVTPELIAEVNAQREAEENATKEAVSEGVVEGLKYLHDKNAWGDIPLATAQGNQESTLAYAEPDDLMKGAAEYYWMEFKARGGDSDGQLWEQIVAPYIDGREHLVERLETAIAQLTEADNWQQLALPDDWWNEPVTVEVDADTTDAEAEVKEAVDKINKTSATITVDAEVSTPGGAAAWTPEKYATGTQDHPGGISLVNDGDGPELLVNNGRAFIANGGKPALVNLERGAKVFTASETREILGNGVPAYAFGTKNIANTDGGGASRATNYGVKSITVVENVTAVPDETAAQETATETAAAQAASATFSSLKDLIEYVINRIGMAIDEQEEIINKQIAELKANREAIQQQNKLEEKRQAVEDALGNRTVRYIDENGQWHWMADANKVQKAQKDLADYEDELAFNAQIQALEDQKTALEEEYKKITKAWSDIQYAVNTPTGDLTQLLSQVIATGSATDKKGAETVQNLLITQLLKGGIFSKNYTEALDSIEKATAGNPIMPGESESTLASLIATASGMGTGTEVTDAMKSTAMGTFVGSGYTGLTGGGTQINYNYFVNGIQLGSDQANEPLSSIMQHLTVYTNTGVA